MPMQWPDCIFNHQEDKITHEDIKSIDKEEGLWFQCRFCDNPKDKDGKFFCRSGNPWSAELLTGCNGHLKNRTHKARKETVLKANATDAAAKGGLQRFAVAVPAKKDTNSASSHQPGHGVHPNAASLPYIVPVQPVGGAEQNPETPTQQPAKKEQANCAAGSTRPILATNNNYQPTIITNPKRPSRISGCL